MSAARRPAASITMPVGVSLLGHAAIIVGVIFMKSPPPLRMPPVYKVDLVAAPAGERAAGVVSDAPAPTEPATTTPPRPDTKAKAAPAKSSKAIPSKAAPRATPNVTAKSTPEAVKNPPKAGAGEVGGKGTDVVGVHTEGIVFPYPGYLQNIVRQIALNFQWKGNPALRAEAFFIIRRDGSIASFRFVSSSGNYAFDLEAKGAVEAAAKAFGLLPAGFTNDALPVIFSFDPSILR